jgi:hypothetical protein
MTTTTSISPAWRMAAASLVLSGAAACAGLDAGDEIADDISSEELAVASPPFNLLNFDIVTGSGGNLNLKANMGAHTFWSFNSPVTNAWGNGGYNWSGDFDGDGYWDVASAHGGNVYLKLNRQSGFSNEVWPVSAEWGGDGYTFVGDFDGNGRADIASMSGGTAYVKLSTGGSFVSQAWPISAEWGGAAYTFAADFNGDRRTDIASAHGGQVFVKLSTGNGFTTQTHLVDNAWGGAGYTFAGDFDCNGLADIASMSGGTAYMKLNYLGNPNMGGRMFLSRTWTVSNQWGGADYTKVGDFNNDGCTDIASAYGSNVFLKYGKISSFLDELFGHPANFENVTGYVAGGWGEGRLTFTGRFQRPGR